MINQFLKRNKLYFSDTYDLTNTFSDNINNPKLFKIRIKNQIKSQFCWNFSFISSVEITDDIIDQDCNFLNPIINGYIGFNLVCCYEKEFNFILISRKDSRRSGVRFLKRGGDLNGNVANFVETEQIISFLEEDDNMYNIISHIQIRGSIPLAWTQDANLSPIPKIILDTEYSKHKEIYVNHINDLSSNYGKIILINLIDKKGQQKKIGQLFENIFLDVNGDLSTKIQQPDIPSFVWFDLNNECRNLKYQNLMKLISNNIVYGGVKQFGFSHVKVPSFFSFKSYRNERDTKNNDNDVQIISSQSGVFRTNCIDTLDRTNIVQTLFSRHVLHHLFLSIKFSKDYDEESSIVGKDVFYAFRRNFEKIFTATWVDNGDALSNSYSGTGAHKSDITRFGKRTTSGFFKDFYQGAKRFYINNFEDGYNQDSHDYFLNRVDPLKFKKRNNKVFVYSFIPIFYMITIILFKIFCNISHASFNFFGIDDNEALGRMLVNFSLFFICSWVAIKFLITVLKTKMIDVPCN